MAPLKSILLWISMIIRQLGNWLKGAPGGEPTGNRCCHTDLLGWCNNSVCTVQVNVLPVSLDCVIESFWNGLKILTKKIKTTTTTKKRTASFRAPICILCGSWYHFLDRSGDLGVALPMQMRIFSPDYICLECGWAFILLRFNPSRCETDSFCLL